MATGALAALDDADISAFSVVQIGVFSTAQLSALSKTQIAAIGIDQLRSLGAARFDSLSTSQISALTAKQIVGLTSAQLKSLRTANIASLKPSQIASLGSEQIATFGTSSIAALLASQVASLTPVQVGALFTNQIRAVTVSAFGALDDLAVIALNTAQVATLVGDQLNFLGATAPNSLTGISAGQTASKLSLLNTAQTNALGTSQIALMSAASLNTLTTVQFSVLLTSQVIAMTTRQVASLEAVDLAALSFANILSLKTSQITAIKAEDLSVMGTAQIATLSAQQLVALSTSQITALARSALNSSAVFVGGTVASNLGGQAYAGGNSDSLVARYMADGRGFESSDTNVATTWVRLLGTASLTGTGSFQGRESSNGVVLAADGSVYSVGYVRGSVNDQTFIGGDRDAYLIKYSPSGKVLWTQLLGTTGTDSFNSIALGPDGLIYVGGFTSGQIGATEVTKGGIDGFVATYSDKNGAPKLESTRQIGTMGNDLVWSVCLGADSALYVAGEMGAIASDSGSGSQAYGGGTTDGFVTKLRSDGTIAWTQWVSSNGNDSNRNVKVGVDGSVYVLGVTNGSLFGKPLPNGMGEDAYLIKYKADGSLAWAQFLGIGTQNLLMGLAIGPDGAICVGGSTTFSPNGQTNSGNKDVFVAKYSSDGVVQWARLYGSEAREESVGLTVGPDGSVYVGGLSNKGASDGMVDALLLKYSAAGDLIWNKQVGASGTDWFTSVAVASSYIPLNSQQIAALSSTQLNALGAETLMSALSTYQLALIGTAQIRTLNGNSVKGLSQSQIAALAPSQFAAISTIGAAALSQGQMVALTTGEAAALSTAQVLSLSDSQLTAMENGDLASISTAAMASLRISQVSALLTAQIASLSKATIGALRTSQINNLLTSQVVSLTSLEIAALSTIQLSALLKTPDTVVSLTTRQAVSISGDVRISVLTESQIAALTTSQIPSLTTAHVSGLSISQLKALTTSQVVVMRTTQIAALTTLQFPNLDTADLAALATSQIAAITTRDLVALTSDEAIALTTLQVSFISTAQLRAFSTQNISVLQNEDVQAMRTSQVAALTTVQMVALARESSGLGQYMLEAQGNSLGADRQSSVLAIGSSGAYVVTWLGQDNAGNDHVYVQQFSASGKPVGQSPVKLDPIDNLSTGHEVWDTKPEIAAIGEAGDYAVTWYGFKGNVSSIYVQKFNANGNAATDSPLKLTSSKIANGNPTDYFSPRVTTLGNTGDIALVWTGSDDGRLPYVLTQRISVGDFAKGAATSFQPQKLQGPGNTTGNNWDGSATAVGNQGQYVVTWYGEDTQGDYSIFIQKFAADGTKVASAIQLEAADNSSGVDIHPTITAIGSQGAFVVTWYGKSGSVTGLAADSVYVQQFSADGTKATQKPLKLSAPGDPDLQAFVPQVMAVGDSGAFVVAWASKVQQGGTGIFVQQFNPDGSTTGNTPVEIPASAPPWGWDSPPSIAPLDTAGSYAITWCGADPNGDMSIYVQKFNNDGTITGNPLIKLDGFANAKNIASWQSVTASGPLPGLMGPDDVNVIGTDRYPQITAVGTDGAFIVSWEGIDSGGDFSIFVQRFNADGSLANDQDRLYGRPLALFSSQVQALGTSQINGLAVGGGMASFTIDQITVFSSTQIIGLSTLSVNALTAAQIASLKTAQIAVVTAGNISSLTSDKINALTTQQFAALTTRQVAALTSAQFPYLQTVDVVALTSAQLAVIPTFDIALLGTTQVGALLPTQWASLTTAQISVIPKADWTVLGPSQLVALKTGQLVAISTTAIGSLDTTQLSGLITQQIAALTPGQIAALARAANDAVGIYAGGGAGGSLGDQNFAGGLADAMVARYLADGTGFDSANAASAGAWVRLIGTAAYGPVGAKKYGRENSASLARAPDGSVYSVGFVRDTINQQAYAGADRDAYLVKYGPDGSVRWTQMLGTTGSDSALSVAVGVEGLIYVGGVTTGALPGASSAGLNDCFVITFKDEGNSVSPQTTKQFGTTGVDVAWSVTVTSDGSLFVAGEISGIAQGANWDLGTDWHGNGQTDGFVSKFNADGTTAWTRIVASWANKPNDLTADSGFDANHYVKVANDGSVYVLGSTTGSFNDPYPNNYVPVPAGGLEEDAYLIKYNADGSQAWCKMLGVGPQWVQGRSLVMGLAIGPDGTLVVSGSTTQSLNGQTNSGGEGDLFVMKYGTDGTVLWTRLYGTDKSEEGLGVTVGPDGSVYVGGDTWSASSLVSNGPEDALLIKYGADGTLVWKKQIDSGGIGSDVFNSLAIDPSYIELNDAQIAALTTAQLNAICGASLMSTLSLAQVAALSTAQISALSTQGITGLSQDQIANLSLAQTVVVSTADIAALKAWQVAAFSSKQSFVLSTAQVLSLKTGQIIAIENNDLASLNPASLGALASTQISALLTSQIASLTALQISILKTNQIAAISTIDVMALGSTQLAAIAVPQLAAFTTAQMAALARQAANAVGVYVGGAYARGQNFAGGLNDAMVSKYTADGSRVWLKTSGSAATTVDGREEIISVASASDGSVYAVGYVRGSVDGIDYVGGTEEAYISRYASDGTRMWSKLVSTKTADRAISVAVALDGSAYITGKTSGSLSSEKPNQGLSDIFVSKYAANGDALWTQQAGTSGDDMGYAIKVASDGSVFVAGQTGGSINYKPYAGGGADAFLAKLSSDGQLIWTQVQGTLAADANRAVALGVDGSIYVAGKTSGNMSGQVNGTGEDLYVTKYAADGNLAWTQLLGVGPQRPLVGLTTGPDGAIYVSGRTSLLPNLSAKDVKDASSQVFWSGNSHIYEFVYAPNGISWSQANIAAQAKTLNGVSGYLATVTSAQEDAFVYQTLLEKQGGFNGSGYSNSTFLGASDAQMEGQWQWTSGPEAGQALSATYTNWAVGQPDNASNQPAQNYLSYLPGSFGQANKWDDLWEGGPANWYVVEYSAPVASATVLGDTGTVGFVTKLNPDGSKSWTNFLTDKGPGTSNSVSTGPDGSVYVAGWTAIGTPTGSLDATLTKYDANGQLAWIRQSNAYGQDWADSVSTAATYLGLSLQQIAALNTAQINAVGAVGLMSTFSNAQLSALSTAQVSALTTQSITGLSQDQIAGLKAIHVVALSSLEVAALKPWQLVAITTGQASVLTIAQVLALSTAQLTALEGQDLACLSTAATAALATSQINALLTSQAASLSAVQIGAMRTSQIAALSTMDLIAMRSVQLSVINTQQLVALTTAQVNALAQSANASVGILASGTVSSALGGQFFAGGTSDSAVARYLADGTDFDVSNVNSPNTWLRLLGTNSTSGIGTRTAGMEVSNSVARAPDGSVYCVGLLRQAVSGQAYAGGDRDAYLIKYARDGSVVWTQLLGTSNSDTAISVAVGSNGYLYIGGTSAGLLPGLTTKPGGNDIFLATYKDLGNQVTREDIKEYGTSWGTDIAWSISLGQDGSLYVAGEAGGDAVLTKFELQPDATMGVAWTRSVASWPVKSYDMGSGGGSDSNRYVKVAADGSAIVLGITTGSLVGPPLQGSTPSEDAYLIKYTADGSVAWVKMLGVGPQDVEQRYLVMGLALGPDGTICVTGRTAFNLDGQVNGGAQDAFVSKFRSDGTLMWTRLFGSDKFDEGVGVAISPDGSVYVGGRTSSSTDSNNTGAMDGLLLKYGSDGTLVWNKRIGAAAPGWGPDFFSNLAIDPSFISFSAAQVSALSVAQINGLGAGAAFSALSTGQVFAFTTSQVASLNTQSLTSLSQEQVYALSATQVAALSTANVAALKQVQLVALGTTQSAALTVSQLSAFSTAQIGALLPKNFAALSNAALAAISTAQTLALGTAQVVSLSTRQLSLIGTGQVASMTSGQLLALANNSIAVYASGMSSSAIDGQAYAGGNGDALLMRYSANGSKAWTRLIGTNSMAGTDAPGNEEAMSVTSAPDGSLYVVGYLRGKVADQSSNDSGCEAYLSKYSSDGTMAWIRLIDPIGGKRDWATSVTVGMDGKVYLSGETGGKFTDAQTDVSGTSDIFVAQYDDQGKAGWSKLMGSVGTDTGWFIRAGADGNLLLASTVGAFPQAAGLPSGQTFGGGVSDGLLTKIKADTGEILWSQLLGSTAKDVASALTLAADGSVYVAGKTGANLSGQINLSGGDDVFVAKYKADGVLAWTRLMGSGIPGGNMVGLVAAADGSVYVSAKTTRNALDGESNPGGADAFIIKLDSDGNKVWTRLATGPNWQGSGGLAIGPDGAIYSAGWTGNTTDDGCDALLLKYLPDGTQVWSQQFGGLADDWFDGLTVVAGTLALTSNQIMALNVSQLNSLGGASLICTLGTAQLQALTTGQIAGFKGASAVALTISQTLALATSQVNALSSVALNAMSTAQLQVLRPAQLVALSTAQLASLRSDKLNVLTTQQFSTITTTQVFGLTTSQIFNLETADFAALGVAQIVALSTAQIAVLSTAEMVAITTEQIRALTTLQVSTLTTTDLTVIESRDLLAMGTAQIAALTPAQINALGITKTIDKLPAPLTVTSGDTYWDYWYTNPKDWSNWQAPSFTIDASFTGNSPIIILAKGTMDTAAYPFESDNLMHTRITNAAGVYSVGSVESFNPVGSALRAPLNLPDGTLLNSEANWGALLIGNPQIGWTQVYQANVANGLGSKSPSDQLSIATTLNSLMGKELLAGTVLYLTYDDEDQSNAGAYTVSLLPGAPTSKLSVLANTQIAALTTAQIAAMVSSALNTLTTQQFAAMRTDQVAVFTTTQASMLETADFAALGVAQIAALSTAQIAVLSTAEMVAITTAQVQSLTTAQVQAITANAAIAMESVDLQALKTMQVVALTTTAIVALAAEGTAPVNSTEIKDLPINDIELDGPSLSGGTLLQVINLSSTTYSGSIDGRFALGMTSLMLDPGAYRVQYLQKGELPGATYDAWGPWGGGNSVWGPSYSIKSDSGYLVRYGEVDDMANSLAAAIQVGHSRAATFSLSANGKVDFFITDSYVPDNAGGVSLAIYRINPGALDVRGPQVVSFDRHTESIPSPWYTPGLMTITFSESIQRGAGSVVLRDSGGKIVATYDVTDVDHLRVIGNKLYFDATVGLNDGAVYVVELGQAAIKDLSGNTLKGATNYALGYSSSGTPASLEGISTGIAFANFTSAQIAAMSPQQLNALGAATRLGAMTGAQLVSLTTGQVIALSTVSVNALNSAQLVALKPTQLSALTTVQVSSLSTFNLDALTTKQYLSLTTAQIAALTTVQVVALETADLSVLDVAQIIALSTADIGVLTTAEVVAISTLQILALTTSQVQAISTQGIATLQNDDLLSLKTSQIAALTTLQVAVMAGSQSVILDVSNLNPNNPGIGITYLPAIGVSKPVQVDVLHPFYVDETNNAFLVAINNHKTLFRIPVGSYELVSFLRELQSALNILLTANSGSETQTNGVTVSFDQTKNQFLFISNRVGPSASIALEGSANWGFDSIIAVGTARGPAVIQSLSVSQVNGLTSTALNALGATGLIAALTTSQIAALNTDRINAFTTQTLTALRSNQIAALGAAQLMGLTTTSIATLSTAQVLAFTAAQVRALAIPQVQALTTSQLASMETCDVQALATNQVVALSTSQVIALMAPSSFADGSIIVAGETNGNLFGQPNQGSADGFVTKYDANGNRVWTRMLGSGQDDWVVSTITGTDNTMLVSGNTYGALDGQVIKGNGDGFISKIMPDGSRAWTRMVGTDQHDQINSSTRGLGGSLIVVGETQGSLDGELNQGGQDGFISKYDTNGNKVWTRQIGSDQNDAVLAISSDVSGALFVGGYVSGGVDDETYQGQGDGFISKYAADGNRVWTRLVGTNKRDWINVTQTLVDGSVLIGGTTFGNLDGRSNQGDGDGFISRYDSNGTRLWTALVGTSQSDTVLAAATASDGSILVAGTTNGNLNGQNNSGNGDGFISKYDANGNLIWTRLAGTSQCDQINAITTRVDGSIWVSGYTEGAIGGQINQGNGDAFVSQYDAQGNLLWTQLGGTDQADAAYSIENSLGINTRPLAFSGSQIAALSSAQLATLGVMGVLVALHTDQIVALTTTQVNTLSARAINGLTTGQFAAMQTKQIAALSTTQVAQLTASQISAFIQNPSASIGSFLVTGYSRGNFASTPNAGGNDVFFSKMISDGTISWTTVIGSSGDDIPSGIVSTPDGSVFAVGLTDGNFDGKKNSGSYDGYLTKFSPDGNKLWTQLVGTSAWDAITGVSLTVDGSIVIVGITNGDLNAKGAYGGSDFFVSKFTSDGTKVWTTVLGGAGDDVGYCITTSQDGSLYVTGTTKGIIGGSPNIGKDDAFLAKLDSAGSLIWLRSVATTGYDDLWATKVSSDGFVYAVGQVGASFNGQPFQGGLNWDKWPPDMQSDAILIKYDSDGNRIWANTFGTPAMDWAQSLAFGEDGSIIVAGITGGDLDGKKAGSPTTVFVSRFQPDGTSLGSKFFANGSMAWSPKIVAGEAGKIYLAGDIPLNNTQPVNSIAGLGLGDAYVAQLNQDGSTNWTKLIGTDRGDGIYGITYSGANVASLPFSTSQVAAISNAALNATSIMAGLSASQVSALTGTQIAGIETINLNSLTTLQFTALATAQIQSLTTAQISNLETADIVALSIGQVVTLSTTQVQALSSSAIAAMETVDLLAMATAQIAALTSYQVAALRPAQLMSLTREGSASDIGQSIGQISNPSTQVFWSGNSHTYEFVNVPMGISWNDASLAAQGKRIAGSVGYLATITSAAEDAFVFNALVNKQIAVYGASNKNLTNFTYLGASDAQVEGQWKWVTGPEAGQSLTAGYSNWAPNQPDNASNTTPQNYLAYFPSDYAMPVGSWDDFWGTPQVGQPTVSWYIVEYSPSAQSRIALTSEQVRSLTSTQIDYLGSVDMLVRLGADQISALSISQINSFNTADINALHDWQIAALTSAQISALTSKNVAAFTTGAILALNTLQAQTLSANQISALSSAQVATLTANNLVVMSIEQIGALPCGLSTAQKAALTTAQIAAYIATPIMLDLNGDGVQTLGLDAGVQFDVRANGLPMRTGWVSAQDGLLVRDRNGDGSINDGSELFGSSTVLAGGVRATDGYQALAELDSNGDGLIDRLDTVFAQLRVWVDATSDGLSAPDELRSLEDWGITSISTQATASTEVNMGNVLGLVSSFQTADGQTHQAADVWFGAALEDVVPTAARVNALTQALGEFAHTQATPSKPEAVTSSPTQPATSSTLAINQSLVAALQNYQNQAQSQQAMACANAAVNAPTNVVAMAAPVESSTRLSGLALSPSDPLQVYTLVSSR